MLIIILNPQILYFKLTYMEEEFGPAILHYKILLEVMKNKFIHQQMKQ